MTYDCFCYMNEDVLLDIRLHELDSVVDQFIICESAYTFTGEEKEFNFDISNFGDYVKKIKHIKMYDTPSKTARERESFQRDNLSNYLKHVEDDDLIIVGDLDEIPSSQSIKLIKSLRSDEHIFFINHRTYCNYLNLYLGIYYGTKVLFGKRYKKNDSIEAIRNYWFGNDIIRQGGMGWHFSWLGGKDKVKEKLKSIAHYDGKLTKEEIEMKVNLIDKQCDTMGRKLEKVNISLDYPEYIFNNQEKFKDFIYA